jgi:hypothetical protein
MLHLPLMAANISCIPRSTFTTVDTLREEEASVEDFLQEDRAFTGVNMYVVNII